ncbi:MAG: RIP metalloprotease RseP [Gammaproteobacteria bacterium]|nr:RIP metalloprotease RseP [Gammaproteobacteria bacterium]CAJ2376625.1 MAG: intramembrane zinc metalloprotease [Arenicellales bacterium IbO2]MDA7962252.1 RIP metalloprotease RseP [Gammaproteobacteria bacterium]MDA7969919.1 RIP metalloprotease RseP [Gammaproteobacteria bacterium]MDA7990119.1 RIP metalloprotease RseP [Gammaproteobacteria bacterium]
MTSFAYGLFGFLAAIAVLVAVHEYGHFWVARRLGVGVLRFSIGFGKPLLRWRRRGDPTEYVIGMIPLGGYVKMLDEREGEVPEELRESAFNRQSLAARSAIVAAGPAFNFLFALFAIWLVLVAGSGDIEPVVGGVEEDSPAMRAGFREGDRLLRIDGREVRGFGQHQLYLLHRAMKGGAVDFEVARDGGRRDLRVDFAGGMPPAGAGLGLRPPPPPAEVFRVVAGSPAEAAGLQRGDLVTEVDGVAVADWNDLAARIAERPGEQMILSLRRDGRALTAAVTPERALVDGAARGRLGIYRPPPRGIRVRYGPLEAVAASADYNWRMTAVTMRSLAGMLTASVPADNLAGPITIARVAGHTAQSGFDDFMRFLAIISISLGLINLLPIPLLDGGHLLFFAFEAVSGRAPSQRAMMRGQMIGAMLLVMLMSLAFYNDIMRLF